MHGRTLIAAMVIAGLGAFGQTEPPTIHITATLPGQSAETAANSVATPLEKEFSKIAGVRSLTSSSRRGETSIVIQFDPCRGIDTAAQDVQMAFGRAQSKLPREMSPPSLTKGDPSDPPIVYLPLTSPSLPLSQVERYAE